MEYMRWFLILLLVAPQLVGAVELTEANWDEMTAGKTVFVKFFAPWCGHCKSMKPDWDKLMKEWSKDKRSSYSLIADVDCIAEGSKALCEREGIEGFPTIKHGDPSSLEAYEGDRDFKSLKDFAEENLKPLCTPVNMEACSDTQKVELESVLAMSEEELSKQIAERAAKMAEITDTFDAELKKLQETYEKLEAKKEADTKELRALSPSIGMLRAVQASRAAGKNAEL